MARQTAVAVLDAPAPVKRQQPEKIKLDPNNVLDGIQRLLTDQPPGWFNAAVRLNNNLVDYLRGGGPNPRWDDFPLARDWFTQNNNLLREIPQ